MKHCHYIAITLILVILSSLSRSQEYKISGKVLDSQTGLPIPNANISLVDSRTGCSSSGDGSFYIVSDTIPVNLIISHINYKTRRIWLDDVSGPFTVLMEPSVQVLKEVEISEKNEPIPFFKDDKYAVLDYEINQDLIYLLNFKFRLSKSELLVKSFYGDTIAPPLTLNFKPTGLFLDCLGYMHVLSKDSIYQVYLGKETLSLIYKYDIEKFHATLEDCVASTDAALYFKESRQSHLEVCFYMIDKHNSVRKYLMSVKDDQKIKMLHNNPTDYYFASMDKFPDSFEGMIDWLWVNRILYTPNESDMRKIGDTLCIFSAVDGTIKLLTLEGQLLSEKTMMLQESATGDWTKEIHIDQVTGEVYTAFNKYGKYTLYQIDLSNGNLDYFLTFSHPFPEKIRVNHGHLFYLYDVPGEGDNKHLYKQKL